jgi:hypothetical protein
MGIDKTLDDASHSTCWVPKMSIDYEAFIAMLGAEFPEVISGFREDERGILHCEMAAFRRAAEESIDHGKLWNAERYFRGIIAPC